MTVPTFPVLAGLSYPVKRTPVFDTETEDALSGARTRYPNRTLPLYRYMLEFEVLREAAAYLEWQTMLGFYNSVLGDCYLFRFNDVSDNTATAESFGSGDGTSTVFQLTRAGSFGFAEPVYAPVAVTQVKVAGVVVNTPGDYSVDLTTGLVTFAVAPAGSAALTWTGTYDWYCRFDKGNVDFSKFMNGLWELKGLSFTTELLPA